MSTREQLDTINQLDQEATLYSTEPYDRCPLCGKLNLCIIASSVPYTDCAYCGKPSRLVKWTRLYKGIEKPRPRGKHWH